MIAGKENEMKTEWRPPKRTQKEKTTELYEILERNLEYLRARAAEARKEGVPMDSRQFGTMARAHGKISSILFRAFNDHDGSGEAHWV